MPTPNKENVEKMMREFAKSLSEKDVEFFVEMAQEGDEKEIAEEPEKGRASHDLRNTRSYGRIGDLRDPRRTSPSLQPEVQCTTPHRLTPGDVPQIAQT
jgi:hypothetical protein